ncbi:unnamed protein product [Musa acuminata subsp. burmannicoides]
MAGKHGTPYKRIRGSRRPSLAAASLSSSSSLFHSSLAANDSRLRSLQSSHSSCLSRSAETTPALASLQLSSRRHPLSDSFSHLRSRYCFFVRHRWMTAAATSWPQPPRTSAARAAHCRTRGRLAMAEERCHV